MICTEETLAAMEKARIEGRSLWRVSSTVFSQLASDEVLRPLKPFQNEGSIEKYPPMPVGTFVETSIHQS